MPNKLKLLVLIVAIAGALTLFPREPSGGYDKESDLAQSNQDEITSSTPNVEYQRDIDNPTSAEQTQGSIYWKDNPDLCKKVAELFYKLQINGGEEAAMKLEIERCETVIEQSVVTRLKNFKTKFNGAGLQPPLNDEYIWADLYAHGRTSVLNRLNSQVSEFRTFSFKNDLEQAFGRMDYTPLNFPPEMHLMRLSNNGLASADSIPPELLYPAAEARDLFLRQNAMLKQEESLMYVSQHKALFFTKELNVPSNERTLFWSTYLPEYARLREESASCALNYVLEMQLLLDEYNL